MAWLPRRTGNSGSAFACNFRSAMEIIMAMRAASLGAALSNSTHKTFTIDLPPC